MPKRKLEEELEADWEEEERNKKGVKKNSLDSDEEDEVEGKTYDILAEDDIEGQEDGAAGFDGEVPITPFNMKEEMEEGHFDKDGNYHWNKDKVVKDNWLENIDWVKIKKPDDDAGSGSDSDTSIPGPPFDHVAVYRQMLELMRPGESVAKALRRLGGNKTVSASERWRRKRAGEGDAGSGSQQQVIDLTEMANKVLTELGDMDIYQKSFEHFTTVVQKAALRGGDAALDMYADDFDDKEKQRLETEAAASKGQGPSTAAAQPPADGEVQWEYMERQDSGEVLGPHSTSQMQAWVESGHFGGPVWVRRVGQEGPFYTSQRVDFELYM